MPPKYTHTIALFLLCFAAGCFLVDCYLFAAVMHPRLSMTNAWYYASIFFVVSFLFFYASMREGCLGLADVGRDDGKAGDHFNSQALCGLFALIIMITMLVLF